MRLIVILLLIGCNISSAQKPLVVTYTREPYPPILSPKALVPMTRYRIVCGPELSYHYNMGFGADRHKKKKVVDLEGSFYFDFEKQKTYTVHLMPREIGTLLITDSFTAGRWTFMSDTRNIKGYKCKLAVTENFKHDSTFVWYTEQIPFRAGPAKFFGFPGLVLEVIDRIEHVHFKVSAIKDRSSGIVLPAYPILSRKEYFEKY